MLMLPTVAVLLLSALSVAVPVTDWAAPLALSVVVALVQLWMPDLPGAALSSQVKLTDTSVLFQPLALAAGDRLPVIVGAVLSRLTVTLPLPLLPTLSAAVDVAAVVPFVVTLVVGGVGPLPMPEPTTTGGPALMFGSCALQVTVTSDLFHPAPFGAGAMLPVTVGSPLSSV